MVVDILCEVLPVFGIIVGSDIAAPGISFIRFRQLWLTECRQQLASRGRMRCAAKCPLPNSGASRELG